MNRIILIGNGFDLAHGMKTTYKDFLKDYWENICNKINAEKANRKIEDENISVYKASSWPITKLNYQGLIDYSNKNRNQFVIKNAFLKTISDLSLTNWVDVEKEYYYLLKKAYRKEYAQKDKLDIEVLHRDFSQVKKLLYNYLLDVEKKFNSELGGSKFVHKKSIFASNLYQPIYSQDLSSKSFRNLMNENKKIFKEPINQKSNPKDLAVKEHIKKHIHIYGTLEDTIIELLMKNSSIVYFNLMPKNVLILNFNYTNLDSIYLNPNDFNHFGGKDSIGTESIHIHGSLNEKDNPIIFGFGDELDKDYKEIEELNDNRFLENIKSVNYLRTDNYKRLLAFMNLDSYQVFICGHSCGNSDRTLLNTLFENDNCVSIKTFYHSKSEDDDNYIEIIKNITRNFNDKDKLRDRVVNKSYCRPLRS